MDTILNDYIQDYFVGKYSENTDIIRKNGICGSAEYLNCAKGKLLTILDKIKAGETLDKSDAETILNNIHISVPIKK